MSDSPYPIPAELAANPWVLVHLEREAALTGEPADVWGPEVLAQYAGHEAAAEQGCFCGGTFWYWARTGGYKCPSCGAFADGTGRLLGTVKAKEDSHA